MTLRLIRFQGRHGIEVELMPFETALLSALFAVL
jgi:hypothetical protein